MNPMFESDLKYETFRATFKIWMPSLYTLDGTDFKNDFEAIVRLTITNQFVQRNKQQEVEKHKAQLL